MDMSSLLSVSEDVKESENVQDTAKKMAQGLLTIYQPGLEKIKNQLDELTKKQNVLISQLDDEYNKLSDQESRETLEQMYAKIVTYTTKLLSVKKDMHQVAEKMLQLKKRALWLQEAKQKEVLQLELQKEFQLQQEQELIAKPNSTNVSSYS